MKNLPKKLWVWLGGLAVLAVLAVVGFNQGAFFQGNFSFAPGLTTKEASQGNSPLTQKELTTKELTVLTIMPTTNQLRLGSNSMFKLILKNEKESTLKRIKMSLALYNLSLNGVKLIMNDTTDVTDQLTDSTQNLLNTALRAPDKKNLTTTFVLGFKENFKVPAGLTTFELVFNTEHLNADSTLLAGVLDAVMSVAKVEKVVEGPLEKIQLFTTYTTK